MNAFLSRCTFFGHDFKREGSHYRRCTRCDKEQVRTTLSFVSQGGDWKDVKR